MRSYSKLTFSSFTHCAACHVGKCSFNVTVDGAEWSVTPQQLLQETGKRGDAAKASLVYSCHCNNSAGGQCEGVLKIGQMAEYEVRAHCKKQGSKRCGWHATSPAKGYYCGCTA